MTNSQNERANIDDDAALEQALQDATSPLFMALLNGFGTPVEAPMVTICLPDGDVMPCLDYDDLRYAQQVGHNDGHRIVLADSHYILVLQENNKQYEVITYKKWNENSKTYIIQNKE